MSNKRRKTSREAGRSDTKPAQPKMPESARGGARRWGSWLLLPTLLLATLAAYQPAWHGGLLWDDESHVTSAGLRSVEGLWRIWFDLGATQQYYPATHTAFWVQQKLWDDNMLGYHLVNIFLHALAAFLLAIILGRLGIPGARLAAVIFALHPIEAESVAWISELKNTLSGVFYLSAAMAYLRFDEERRRQWYSLATVLFILALLSKTVTATLPAALLVVFWWQRGSLSLRRDVRPLVPFFAIGAAGGLFTVWVEQTLIGAKGAEFQFNLIERFLIAGRGVWFYLGKLLWPTNLAFIYPRWEISQRVWWQYLFPLGVAALFAGFWWLRKRSRAPLAALLFFCSTIFPGIGFFNVYPFRYSFVADHFQYLAGIAVIVLFSSGAASLVRKWRIPSKPAAAMTLIIGGLLGFLTWNESHQYVDSETLYRTTIRRNPTCWWAHNNLGMLTIFTQNKEAATARSDQDILAIRHKLEEATAHLQEALRLKPDYAEAYNNMGFALQGMGRLDEAIKDYQEALRLKPDYADACNNLGFALQRVGRLDEAVTQYEHALQFGLDTYATRSNLGLLLQQSGRPEAVHQLEEALRLKPDSAEAHANLGNALQWQGRLDEAMTQFTQALQYQQDNSQAHFGLGNTLLGMNRPGDAISEYQKALQFKPDYVEARNNLGNVLVSMGRLDEAVVQYREALKLDPSLAEAHINLGIVLQNTGRLAEAVAQYQEALRYSPNDAEVHNNLGVAFERLGRINEAIAEFTEALRLKPDFPIARANLARLRK